MHVCHAYARYSWVQYLTELMAATDLEEHTENTTWKFTTLNPDVVSTESLQLC